MNIQPENNTVPLSQMTEAERCEQLIEALETADYGAESWTKAVDYGAGIIGQLVVRATVVCNHLSPGGSTEHKDLIQLVLGHVELEKAAILQAASAQLPFVERCQMMDECLARGLEYFNSILCQVEDLDRP